MAKRFISTDIFSDEFFSDLTIEAKLFFIYYITNCDHAGIFKLNKKLFEFQTGIKSIDTVIKELGNSIVTVRGENIFFMPKFIKFQYPDFPKSAVKQQDSALKILLSYGIDIEKLKSYLSVRQELSNSYDNVNDNDNDNVIIDSKEKNHFFKNEDVLELPDIKINSIIELYKITKQTNVTKKDIIGLWEVFKVQNLTGEKYYKSINEVYSHFINWNKTQKIQKNDKPTPSTTGKEIIFDKP
jgi:hypothetical protein